MTWLDVTFRMSRTLGNILGEIVPAACPLVGIMVNATLVKVRALRNDGHDGVCKICGVRRGSGLVEHHLQGRL